MVEESFAGSLSVSLTCGYESRIKLSFVRSCSNPVEAILA